MSDHELQASRPDELSRAQQRRSGRDVIEEGAPREGVDIIRQVEHAILVGVQLDGRTNEDVESTLDELEALVNTAGGIVVKRIVQRLSRPNAATYVGSGKVEELRQLAADLEADAVVFDDDLSPAQQRTLEERIKQKVLDRTIVILDIFAQHAHSNEGKAQVELAQLQYLLPRLRGWGAALSRQEGRMGSRGPGETQLEVDRRRIMRRITKLKRDLKGFVQVRDTRNRSRSRNQVPTVAIVGYTNAGKSTLMNRLTDANVLVRDQLFATLDTTARQLGLPSGRHVVLTDTVGFIRKLPHGLVEAFHSTLEESAEADLILLVADAAHPEMRAHVEEAKRVLETVGASEVPRLLVLNQADRTSDVELDRLAAEHRYATGDDPLIVSAKTGRGIDELLEEIDASLVATRRDVDVVLPPDRADLVALAHQHGEVSMEQWQADGVRLRAHVDVAVADEIEQAAAEGDG